MRVGRRMAVVVVFGALTLASTAARSAPVDGSRSRLIDDSRSALMDDSRSALMDDARPCFYFYGGERRPLALDPRHLLVHVSGARAADRLALDATLGLARPTGFSGWLLVDTPIADDPAALRAIGVPVGGNASADVERRIDVALGRPDVDFASPVFQGADGGWVAVTPEILLQLEPGARKSAAAVIEPLLDRARIVDARFGDLAGGYRLRSASRDGFEVLALANRLAQDPRVAWAEPNMQFTGRSADVTPGEVPSIGLPNDPGFARQWGVHNTGQFLGIPGLDMGGLEAWDLTTGSRSVPVLVLDVGVQQNHPDLTLLPGADFTDDGGDGGPVNPCDNHGTNVAGCIASILNNGRAGVGIAPSCPVLSARIAVANVPCDQGWIGDISATVYALAWGHVSGARVSNNSNFYGFKSNAIDAAYASTRAGGMLHFAASGNQGLAPVAYPASIPAVLAVAALHPDGQLAAFSNHGPDVEFTAPGALISTADRSGADGWSPNDELLTSGTSFACPYAAGVAALIFAQDTTRTPDQVQNLLVLGCRDLGDPGRDDFFGWGLVHAFNSLTLGLTPSLGVGSRRALVSFDSGWPNPFVRGARLRFTLAAADRVALEVFDAGGGRVRVLADRAFEPGPHVVRWDGAGEGGRALPAGLYFVRLRAGRQLETRKLIKIQ